MSEHKIPVIIDCDPGCDDAAALLLAFRSPQLDIRAITTVAGNVELEKNTLNALKICELIGTDVPVSQGAGAPLCCALRTAAYVHGEDGLRGIPLPAPKKQVSGEAAWDTIYREAVACQGQLELIAVGPFTNVAIALGKYPDLPRLIKRIVIMGGSAAVGGNTTAAAEFNVLVDPEAADMVFASGIPVYMCGLDVTHKAYLTPAEVEEIAALGSPQAVFFGEVTRGGVDGQGLPGVPMHDPCAVLFVLDESLFTHHHCWVRVETAGSVTRGKTVTDFYSDAKLTPNTHLVLDIDRERFVSMVKEIMARY